jgi:hypothetical protein
VAAGERVSEDREPLGIADRFRGFLPVAVDVETGGFNAATDALLEIAAVVIEMTPFGELRPGPNFRYHVQPFHGSRIDPASLAVNGIDPHHPLRPAMPEREALTQLFREIRKAVRDTGCTCSSDTTRRSTSGSSTPPSRAPTSSATRSTRFRASTRRRSAVWHSGRRFCREP